MGLIDRLFMKAKNVASRSVDLHNHPDGFELTIVEHGHERSHVLSYVDVVNLQEKLWSRRAVANGICMNFPPNPLDMFQHFEIPPWAMERLRDDMINERIRLTASI